MLNKVAFVVMFCFGNCENNTENLMILQDFIMIQKFPTGVHAYLCWGKGLCINQYLFIFKTEFIYLLQNK